jgi:hypothetical protein
LFLLVGESELDSAGGRRRRLVRGAHRASKGAPRGPRAARDPLNSAEAAVYIGAEFLLGSELHSHLQTPLTKTTFGLQIQSNAPEIAEVPGIFPDDRGVLRKREFASDRIIRNRVSRLLAGFKIFSGHRWRLKIFALKSSTIFGNSVGGRESGVSRVLSARWSSVPSPRTH